MAGSSSGKIATKVSATAHLPARDVGGSAPRAQALPIQLGPYTLHERLGAGGMAEVFLAVRAGARRRVPVVIKRLRPRLAGDDEYVTMLTEEVRLVSLFRHPNIARVLEFGRTVDGPFVALELVAGEPLARVLATARSSKARVPAVIAAQIVSQIAAAIHHAHEVRDGTGRPLRIVHRDLSPDNILVSFDGDVKLIDFGIAKGEGTRAVDTQAGVIKGKVAYMSPEQARARSVDHRTDVFALGIILWEVVSGRRLFRRESELETLRAVIEEPPPNVPRLLGVDPELVAITERALAKDPAQRFQTALGMRRALERYLARAAAPGEIGSQALGWFMRRMLPERAAAWDTRLAALTDPHTPAPSRVVARTADLEVLNADPADDSVMADAPPEAAHSSAPPPVTRPASGKTTRRHPRLRRWLVLLGLIVAALVASSWISR